MEFCFSYDLCTTKHERSQLQNVYVFLKFSKDRQIYRFHGLLAKSGGNSERWWIVNALLKEYFWSSSFWWCIHLFGIRQDVLHLSYEHADRLQPFDTVAEKYTPPTLADFCSYAAHSSRSSESPSTEEKYDCRREVRQHTRFVLFGHSTLV